MAATLELKYFNSFWLKKLDSIVNVTNTIGSITADVIDSNVLVLDPINVSVSVGQALDWDGKPDDSNPTVVYVDGANITFKVLTMSGSHPAKSGAPSPTIFIDLSQD